MITSILSSFLISIAADSLSFDKVHHVASIIVHSLQHAVKQIGLLHGFYPTL